MPNLCDLPVGLLRQILQHYVESDTIRMRPDQFPENGHTIVHQLYDAMRVNKLWYDILDEDMWAPDFLPPMIGPKQSRWKSRRTGYLYGTLAEHVTDKIDEHERQRIRLKEEHEAKTRPPPKEPRVTINDLPAELLRKILHEHLDFLLSRLNAQHTRPDDRCAAKGTFFDVMVVSKAWCTVVQEHLWGQQYKPKLWSVKLGKMVMVLGIANWNAGKEMVLEGWEDYGTYESNRSLHGRS